MTSDCLRTGDKATVHFRFIKTPEYLHLDQRLVFREGRTKAVGTITKVSFMGHKIECVGQNRIHASFSLFLKTQLVDEDTLEVGIIVVQNYIIKFMFMSVHFSNSNWITFVLLTCSCSCQQIISRQTPNLRKSRCSQQRKPRLEERMERLHPVRRLLAQDRQPLSRTYHNR